MSLFKVKRKYNDFENLKKQVAEVMDEKQLLKRHIDAVASRGGGIEPEFGDWLNSANKLIEKANALGVVEENVKGEKKNFFDPKSLSELSKQIAEFMQEARGSFPVFFREFKSRVGVLEKIMEALKKPSIKTVRVYGEAGVGKTMLVEEVKKQAEQEKLFDAVVMARETRNPDLERIQYEIACDLGLDLPDRITSQGVADRIKSSLANKKVLVILDDIWAGTDLKKVGIPVGNNQKQTKEGNNEGSSSVEPMECMVLQTARYPDVFPSEMHTHEDIEVFPLKPSEALQLFEKIAGGQAKSHVLQPIAEEISEKCNGLPIAIATLASSLKGKSPKNWRTTLRKLLQNEGKNLSVMPSSLYSAIDLRYSDLKSKELKQTLLLCCLMSHNAAIRDLLKYGIGLVLFTGANSIEAAQEEAAISVKKLRESSLLLDGGSNMHFDMRDPIREVAISIACEDHAVLALRKGAPDYKLDKQTAKKFNWIFISNGDTSLPDELKCPQLTFFHLSNNDSSLAIPKKLFRRTEGLRVLGLTKMDFSSPNFFLSSSPFPINLHTLRLDQSKFGRNLGSIIGDLKNLEVLSLVGCDIENLPWETKKLAKLKLLDLSDCIELKVIPSDVFSSLSQLEELYLGNSFDQWKENSQKHGNHRNASLVELTRLGKLTALELRIHDISMIPPGLFSPELKRYKILIGDVWSYWNSSFENSSKVLKLKLNSNSCFDFSVRKLLKKTDELHLQVMSGVKNVVNELDDHGFQQMKCPRVKNCREVQHIIINPVNSPCKAFTLLEVLFLHKLFELEKIFHGQFEATSFNKLRIITVEGCQKLKNFFPISIAKQLLHLQEIRVRDCRSIVQLIDNDRGEWDSNDIEEEEIKLGELRCLRLQYLPQFISFCNEIEKDERYSCALFSGKVLFPDLREVQLSWINISTIWHKELAEKCCCSENLTKLIVEGCDNLKHLFSVSIVSCLKKLRHLEIRQCIALTEIIVTEREEKETEILFRDLSFLHIEGLQKLLGFCSRNYLVKFPSLKELAIKNCPEMKGFMTSKDTTSDEALFDENVTFPSLERMTVSHLKKLKIMWHNLSKDYLPKLNFLQMEDLQNLLGFCRGNDSIEFPLLKQLAIGNCPELKGFVLESSSTDITNGVQALFNEKVAFPSLEMMIISFLKNFKMIWGELSTDSFCKLKSLKVAYCEKLSTIFPSDNDMLRKFLGSLEKLEIIGCGSIEEVFELGKLSITESHTGMLDTQLRELHIQRLSGLKHVWKNYPQGIITFKKLESVTVASCDGLKHLFPYSLATSLSQLKKLEILTSGVEEIVAMGGENEDANFMFHSLSCLILHSLSRLRYFYQGKHTIHWPALQTFYFYPATIEQDHPEFPVKQPFFSKKEVIPKLKKLSLTNYDIEMFSKDQDSTSKNFDSIEVLRILHYTQSSEFPISFLQKFGKLNKLAVEFCDFKQLFPSDSKELSSMRRLKLNSLGNIIHIWSQDSSVPQKLGTLKVLFCDRLIRLSTPTASFQHLTTLVVWSCREMKNLISFTTAKSLVQLKSLSLRECRMLTEIVEHEGDATEIVEHEGHAIQKEINFKELSYLRLECLTRLTSFCSGNFTFKFPSLELVIVNQCPKLKIFCEGVLETPLLQRVHISERKDKSYWESDLNATMQKLQKEKVAYSEMEILELSEFPELIGNWNTNPQNFFSFRQLISLEVCNVSNLTYLLTPSMVTDLVRLTRLDVKNCKMMEKIIKGVEAVEENKLIFHQLKVITLESCSKLTSFSTGGYTLKFPSLLEVSIADCPNMGIFASAFSSYQEREASEPFLSKVEFPNLKSLTLLSVCKIATSRKEQEGSILRSIVLLFESFRNSRTVSRSHGCKTLMGYSIAMNLNHLSDMTITDCSSLEEIIACGGDEERDDIILPQFKCLGLHRLPKLASFCSGRCNFKFPSLHKVIVSECPKLHIFSKGVTETRNLKKVKLTENDDGSWKDDNLNSTIQYLFKNGSLDGPRNKTTFMLNVIVMIFILLFSVYFNFVR